MSGKLDTGVAVLEWDTEVPATVDTAKAEFDRLVKEGYSGVAVTAEGPAVVDRFTTEAPETHMIPRMAGGAQ